MSFDPITLALALALLALVPILVVVCTCFLKISVVMSLLRNALGVQQIPPNMALYGMSLILTLYVMAPVGQKMYESIREQPQSLSSLDAFLSGAQKGSEPLRAFLYKHSKPEQRAFFVRTAKRLWPPEMAAKVRNDDFLVLVPAFVIAELTTAFEVGFLLYLPFLVIDLVVSNILLAMGMMMVSPVTISLPLKLFLFVMVDGWTRLIQGLVLTYV
ncbi:type III secretion system export apparatus subunit SctR [Chitinimonas lacunae]|uniref:Type III secretion system export apparatus subunit SctR n=1 Tax=Chitinimonas lacunae TaxID=1963018 RepID=A0ABV8MSB9_9NEIS